MIIPKAGQEAEWLQICGQNVFKLSMTKKDSIKFSFMPLEDTVIESSLFDVKIRMTSSLS